MNSQEDINEDNSLLIELATDSLKRDYLGEIPYYKINDWKIYSSVTIAKEILDRYYELILCKNLQADYFCPIPTSGLTLLSGMIKTIGLKPLTFPKKSLYNHYFDFEDHIKKNPKVIIGDLTINTGTDLEKTISILKKINAEIVGIFFIVFNDTYPGKFPPNIEYLNESGKIHYLVTVSQLLKANSNQDH